MTITPVSQGELFRLSATQEPTGGEKSFGDYLQDAVTEVNNLQKEADAASEKLALGEISDIHEVGIATETAYLSLLLTVQIRNKILDAYHEVMRMQV